MYAFMFHMKPTKQFSGMLLASGLSLVLTIVPAAAQAAVPGDASDIADVLEDAETVAVGTPTPSDVEPPCYRRMVVMHRSR